MGNLFSWQEWDDIGSILSFKRCVLTVPIKKWPVGTCFERIDFNFENGYITLFDKGEQHHIELKISVVE